MGVLQAALTGTQHSTQPRVPLPVCFPASTAEAAVKAAVEALPYPNTKVSLLVVSGCCHVAASAVIQVCSEPRTKRITPFFSPNKLKGKKNEFERNTEENLDFKGKIGSHGGTTGCSQTDPSILAGRRSETHGSLPTTKRNRSCDLSEAFRGASSPFNRVYVGKKKLKLPPHDNRHADRPMDTRPCVPLPPACLSERRAATLANGDHQHGRRAESLPACSSPSNRGWSHRRRGGTSEGCSRGSQPAPGTSRRL